MMHILTFLVLAFAHQAEGVTPEELTRRNQSTCSSIWSMKVTVQNNFDMPDGLTAAELAFMKAQDVAYDFQSRANTDEYRVTQNAKPIVGEFTGKTFQTGVTLTRNGPDGFYQLKHFDGQLDGQGECPADSPASGIIDDRREWSAPVLARMHLGLEVFNPIKNQTLPLDQLRKAAKTSSVEVVSEQAGKREYRLSLNCDNFSGKFLLAEEFSYMITSAEVTCSQFTHTMEYSGFKQFGSPNPCFLPTRFVNTVRYPGGRPPITTQGTVTNISLNSTEVISDAGVPFPPLLPFTDFRMGKSGAWSNSGPPLYFKNDSEAIAWADKRKSIAKAQLRSHVKGPFSWTLATVLASAIGVGAWWFLRNFKK